MNLTTIDQDAFGALIEPHRRELQVHCYRMLGSVEDAEDMVQEAFLRAWQRRETYEGRASLRAWLYRIATNVCLDTLKKLKRRVVPQTYRERSQATEPIPEAVMEPIWLQPYPDELLAADGSHDPAKQITTRENIALAFIAALQLLPPRQRAVLLLRDVLELPANEVALQLDMTVSAVKSALYRARTTMTQNSPDSYRTDSPVIVDETLQPLLKDYVQAWENADAAAMIKMLTDEATFSMPPIPSWYRGKDEIRTLVTRTIFAGENAAGRWKLVPTMGANLQPAYGLYRIAGDGQHYAAYGVQVLTLQGHAITNIISFRFDAAVKLFNLQPKLPK